MNICLCPMSKALAREYFREFIVDPALFLPGQEYRPYIYTEAKADATVDRQLSLGRIHLAIMLDGKPIGEIILKQIDYRNKHCTMGISLRSDDVKNRGIGTEAEIQTLRYAFTQMEMETVFADSVLKNTRSQHVLEKVGFIETHRDDSFIYYRCDRDCWKDPAIRK